MSQFTRKLEISTNIVSFFRDYLRSACDYCDFNSVNYSRVNNIRTCLCTSAVVSDIICS